MKLNLNRQELLVGFSSTITLFLKLGWIAIILALISSFLWAYTGSGAWKGYRRLCIPWMAAIVSVFYLNSLIPLLSVPLGFGVLCVGDSFPSLQPPDVGSWLGQQIKKLGFSDAIGGELTKWCIPLMLQLSFIPIWLS